MRNLENTMHHATTSMYFQEKNQKQRPNLKQIKLMQNYTIYNILIYISSYLSYLSHLPTHDQLKEGSQRVYMQERRNWQNYFHILIIGNISKLYYTWHGKCGEVVLKYFARRIQKGDCFKRGSKPWWTLCFWYSWRVLLILNLTWIYLLFSNTAHLNWLSSILTIRPKKTLCPHL